MDLTPEERAVLAKVCATRGGHQYDLSELITPALDGIRRDIRARDVDALPHISCQRCGRVWLIVAEGESYEAAEATLNGELAPQHRRPLRAERRAARAAREAKEQTVAQEARAAETPIPAATPAQEQSAARPIPPAGRPG